MEHKIIYLYIKTSPLGLKYLGKTTQNPFTYIGSGKYWKSHLNHHGFKIADIKTEILFESSNIEIFREKAIEYSKYFNIVESDEWANLMMEDGIGGGGMKGRIVTEETREKIRKANKGKPCLPETRKKIGKANKDRVPTLETRNKLSKNHSRHNAKLRDNDVHKICQMYKSGATTNIVQSNFPNIHYVTLSEIRRKKRYKHITDLYDLKKPSKFGCIRKKNTVVYCVEDNLKFNGIKEAANHYKISFQAISKSAINNVTLKINKTFQYV